MITETKIQTLLEQLQRQVTDISQLRESCQTLEANLNEIQRDYQQYVGQLNVEHNQLTQEINRLRATLAQINTPAPETPVVIPPLPPEFQPKVGMDIKPPPPPPKDTRSEKKRSLADFLESVIAPEARETVMQAINAVLADERRDIGDMLEALTWGDLWSYRTP